MLVVVFYIYCQTHIEPESVSGLSIAKSKAEVEIWMVGWLLEFYVLGLSKAISRWVPMCDSVESKGSV